ncbi:MAG: UvrD-helicase domain-containing protein [Acidobacteriota bacterium]
MTEQPRFDFDRDRGDARDAEARRLAVDPTRNVALEASAGTGKTRVLVERYVRLILAGVHPRHILAITFTRKAAAEMRQRVLQELANRRREGALTPERWRELAESAGDVTISTIDAFCLALLREFPLEADVDPGFELADETETPRLIDAALDRSLRIGRAVALDDPEVALLFGELGEFRLRAGLARLIDRRLVTWPALHAYAGRTPRVTIADANRRLLLRLRAAFATVSGGVDGFVASGPAHPDFQLLTDDLRQLLAEPPPAPPAVQALLERVRDHLLTKSGEPRKRMVQKKAEFSSAAHYQRHAGAVAALGPHLVQALDAYRQDINRVLARGVQRLFAVALEQYRRTLVKHGLLDFTDLLQRSLALLDQMDEFSRSRYKLEARYQHVLVDEFQDTSRAQWALVERLVKSWGAGHGLSEGTLEPSIFIVGDRKQSIYGFRDADVAVLDEAARYIAALRPGSQVRSAITRSFRAVRELLAFVNDLCAAIERVPDRPDAFRYGLDDVFPLAEVEASESDGLTLVAAASDPQQANLVADEIARLLTAGVSVRDRDSGARRTVRPGDIAILFRTREGHRLFEDALSRRRVPFYVYKGLGFFDADEIRDVLALLQFLARPSSDLHAAALLRSGIIRLTDEALKRLAPALSRALLDPEPPSVFGDLHPLDQQRLRLARASASAWVDLVDRLPPAELLDRALDECAYVVELSEGSARQARENLKKIRGLVRRIQNRGYASLERIVEYLSTLVTGGDESNAIVDARDAVNLMTVHAAKGLEFPVVFVVNLQKGSGGAPDPIRVFPAALDDAPGEAAQDEPDVAIGDHEGTRDRELEAREAEESKRLLYVALTRARDRLYLGTTLTTDGRFVPAKGGLGRMLPASFAGLLATASASEARWAGASAVHRWRVVNDISADTVIDPPPAVIPAADDEFSCLAPTGPTRVAATATSDTAGWSLPGSNPDSPSSREAGTLVHRVLASGILERPASEDAAALHDALRDEERADADLPALIGRAVTALVSLRLRADVAPLFQRPSSTAAWHAHEVAFSFVERGTIVHGRIDCLVKHRDGHVEVLEFKTGAAEPGHAAQLGVYVRAAQLMFPEAPVTGRIVYATGAEQLSATPGV